MIYSRPGVNVGGVLFVDESVLRICRGRSFTTNQTSMEAKLVETRRSSADFVKLNV
jgi:hypothetical protein